MGTYDGTDAVAPFPVLRLLLLLLGALLAALTLTACEDVHHEETRLFDLAEERLRAGDYEGARTLFRRFLEEHPQSTLRSLADRRLITLDRELDAIMGRRGAPAPIHVPPPGSEILSRPEAPPTPRVDAPRMPALGD
ncbi:MAG: hypothetical protein EA398_05935 [Deltaproteobacteria bacterium]|nr:MAG: hypothetical protein EA398_05935 [Deltaproteobacteria bacterium]